MSNVGGYMINVKDYHENIACSVEWRTIMSNGEVICQ